MKKKIKIFLGAYPNFLNAQNINCRALSEHLDKERFEVSTMLFPIQNANDFRRVAGVKYIPVHRPVRFWQYIAYLRGIAGADVAYLPKGELDGYTRFVAKLFGTKLFTTLEGLIDDGSLVYLCGSPEKGRQYVEHYSKFEPNLYSITQYLADVTSKDRGFHFDKQILYLGVESEKFINPNRKTKPLHDIIFIGNLPYPRKNIYDFLEVAAACPDINFHMVGGNQLKGCTVEEYIRQNKLTNLTYHGHLDHTALAALLANIDLMYFPSRSEGFPKVHLETACAGVPTLCYPDYGAAEWIESGVNGIIVDNKEEALAAIRDLAAHPEQLKQLSANAVELGRQFDWKNLVGAWETVIERIYNQ
jgi:glycosyltransferase involved in cell wall biosynthesis